jgi:hypothetical protein
MKSRAASASVFREFMSEMLRKRFWLSPLFVLAAAGTPYFAQQTSPQAVLFKRYDRGAGYNRIIEDILTLTIVVKQEDRATVAMRVCSKQPLPLAIFPASADPFQMAELLTDGYAYLPEHVVFLRAEDCLGEDPLRGITEIWTLSEGASLPAHIEKVVFTDAQRFALGKKPARLEIGVRDYKIALNKLIEELQRNPAARGVVVGLFLKRPSAMLQRRIREVKRTLERSGLPPDRYLVYTDYLHGEASDSDPEPLYPEIYIIKKAN